MVVVVAVVVFGTAAVAAGAGGTMGAPARGPQLLADVETPVRPADLEQVRFPVVLRGYRMEAVDQVLARLGSELEARDARVSELEARLGIAPEHSWVATGGPSRDGGGAEDSSDTDDRIETGDRAGTDGRGGEERAEAAPRFGEVRGPDTTREF
jgi:DivIVA domain-containing protein